MKKFNLPPPPASNDPDPAAWRPWLDEALGLADQAAREDEVPVGALLVDAKGEILGRGYNRRETDQSPLAHAELLALDEASRGLQSWRLTGATLVVTLEPCPMCLAACQQARIDRVVYAAEDPKGGALSLGYRLHEDPRTNHRFPVIRVPDERCGAILTEFFRKKRHPSGG
jgi:tRNA(adenine34) deaminase